MASELVPYIFLYGRCEEALEFYKSVFGGSYEMMRVGDTPGASEMPPSAAQRVMHARFAGAGITFMASDGRDSKPVDTDSGNISLGLTLEDGAAGERIFHALAAGGSIDRPIDAAFWGGRFGAVVDKFGTEWLVSFP